MLALTINGKPVEVPEGITILDAARSRNIRIPTLCHLQDVHGAGACRLCVVEVEGEKNLMASCITPVRDGMRIHTHSETVRKARKILFELLLSDHPEECLQCGRNGNCELQDIGELIGIDQSRFGGQRSKDQWDDSSPSIIRDDAKCILCRRCVTICNEVQEVGILDNQFRGFSSRIGPGNELLLDTTACTYCGQCVLVCPVGALKEKDATSEVRRALADPDLTVIVQTAPAIRAALGEAFGYEPGTRVTGKMASALREMGFDVVFDTNFAADLTIMEEGMEFLERIAHHFFREKLINEQQLRDTGFSLPEHQSVLPMITSCSPGWIKYVEHHGWDCLDNLSTCKSPHMMLGALCKSYFARKIGIDPSRMVVVSIMPCTAKKYEITRPEMQHDGLRDVDAVLTTRELARMIKEDGIDFAALPEGDFDSPLGLSTGAADIFGVTGGVMEAALRTVFEVVTGRELPFPQLHVTPIQGLERVKTAELTITDPVKEWAFLDGVTLRMATTSGLAGASALVKEIQEGQAPYHFIEIMGCPGGCISGGGQPRPVNDAIRKLRTGALYTEDEGKVLRKSHENPHIKAIYEAFLEKPLGHNSHRLLHTRYTKRERY